MAQFKAGDKVIFIKPFPYDDYCSHCGSEITEYIPNGVQRAIININDGYIEVYEAWIDINEAEQYIKIVGS